VRFHDFHLVGYTVSDYGGTIVLELVYDYPQKPRETSRIKFSDVAAYHFVHAGGAIILDIVEVPLGELLQQIANQLTQWWRLHGGYAHWSDDREKYLVTLEEHGYHGWNHPFRCWFRGFRYC
jgi:hypothetical protein